MILSALKYNRYAGESREWYVEGRDGDYAYFDNLSLLVGKNASGKSRTLNVIREIANLLSEKITLPETIVSTQQFDLLFDDNGIQYRYLLHIKKRLIEKEILYIGGEEKLNREKNILIDKEGKTIVLKTDNLHLAVTQTDQDGVLYIPSLATWGKSLKNYLFANQIEKRSFVTNYTNIDEANREIDEDDTSLLVYTFYKGRELFGDDFVSDVIAGMEELDYYISGIDIQETRRGFGLCIEEEGKYMVSQREMSQGMFRALSLFIMLAYARLTNSSYCLLVDDMGEGLDFDSSKRIIDTVIRKINKSNIQLFMSTNDRNVMNHIPLRYWSIIDRDHDKSIFYDSTNSKENFEDFKYTGLNNFDFLATDFYSKGFGIMNEEND